MALPTLRLEATGLDPLPLDPFDGWIVQAFDWQPGAVREVVEDTPDGDGTIDTTALIGAGSVTISMVLAAGSQSLWTMRQRLKRYTSPRRRPILYVRYADDAPEQRIVLRASQFTDPLDDIEVANVVAQWVAPSGIIESAELHSVTAAAGGYDEQPGRTYDLTFDRGYPTAEPSSGGALCANAGDHPVSPVVTMFGPASDWIVLRNDTIDREMVFASELSIAAGDWVRVDFAAKTIENSTGTSYYDTVDSGSSRWWQLEPGENRIFMIAGTFDGAASVQVDWRDGFL